MTYRRRGRGRRPAFTLIEMLVVIAIIAVLVSLTTAAVMRALVKIPEAQTKAELSEFESKLGEAKSLNFNNIPVLPSHLRLREDGNYAIVDAYTADRQQTKAFLQQAFGRHVTDAGNQIDWNGDGTITTENPPTAAGDLVLEGEQCLVFWLGGIPQVSGTTISMSGFSTSNQANPAAPGGSRTHVFEFQNPRLKMFTAPGSGAQFPVYLDPWKNGAPTTWTAGTPNAIGMPYAYFASYKTEGNGLYQADCPSLAVSPYTLTATAYVNAGSFQILSAGRDGVFGPGGLWTPATGLGGPAAAKDDWGNFSPRMLGSPAN